MIKVVKFLKAGSGQENAAARNADYGPVNGYVHGKTIEKHALLRRRKKKGIAPAPPGNRSDDLWITKN